MQDAERVPDVQIGVDVLGTVQDETAGSEAVDLFDGVELQDPVVFSDDNLLDAIAADDPMIEDREAFSLDDPIASSIQDASVATAPDPPPVQQPDVADVGQELNLDAVIRALEQTPTTGAMFDEALPDNRVEVAAPQLLPEERAFVPPAKPTIEELLQDADAVPFDVPHARSPVQTLPYLPEENIIDDDRDKIQQLFHSMLGIDEQSPLVHLVNTLASVREHAEMHIDKADRELAATVDMLDNSVTRVAFIESRIERMRSY